MNLKEINRKQCLCGKDHIFESEVIVGEGVVHELANVLGKMHVKHAFVLADNHTFSAAGSIVCQQLLNHNIKVSKYVFTSQNLEPDESSVGLAIMNFDPKADAIIGVGSGVINDISKIVAATANKPYIIVATAPSMDGYVSATSSMTMAGLKISLPSKAADVIIGDLDILSRAPMKMMVSGLGDMLAKYVSICEWRISNVINGEYYCEEIAKLIRDALKQCVDHAEGLLNREKDAVKAIFEGLVICGAAMKMAGVSRPASGVEHYLSHIWDMRGAEFGTPVELHGIQCAVGTILAIQLYEKMLQITPQKEKALEYANAFVFSEWAEELKAFIGKGAESMIALEEKEQKYNPESHAKRLEIIIEKWDEIKKIIKEEVPERKDMIALYDKMGLPKTLKEIGLEEDILPMTFKTTKDIRDKYVLSRLCWDLGVIDEML